MRSIDNKRGNVKKVLAIEVSLGVADSTENGGSRSNAQACFGGDSKLEQPPPTAQDFVALNIIPVVNRGIPLSVRGLPGISPGISVRPFAFFVLVERVWPRTSPLRRYGQTKHHQRLYVWDKMFQASCPAIKSLLSGCA